MKRMYTRVSDDEYTEFRKAIVEAGFTVEQAIRKGLKLLLFKEETQNVRNSGNSGSEKSQKAGKGN